MVYLHKFFKSVSLPPEEQSFIIASSCVFLAAKVRYTPVSLRKAAQAFYELEKRRKPQLKASLSEERENYYKQLIEDAEFQVI
jgi:hypothetical protein